jgi:1-acyl-sn-glycerol-3-phosphate acyltransferase
VKIFSYIHHTWYYLVAFTTIVVLLPALLWTARPGGNYNHFFKVAKVWSWMYLVGMGVWPRPGKYRLAHDGPVVLSSNHGSDLDIPLTFLASPTPVVFMGKAELLKLPLFGYFFKQTSIAVDRSSFSGRKQAMIDADQKIKEGYSVCIFPEGGIPPQKYLMRGFKAGAFKLAVENSIPVVLVSIYQSKYRLGDWGEPSSVGPVDTKVLGEFWADPKASNPVQELMDRSYRILATDLKNWGHTGEVVLPLVEN